MGKEVAPLTFGSLFAGIGGFDLGLGLERAGMVCKWQVEIDNYARRVLQKHWPNVERWCDVRTFPPEEGDWRVDLICGGFPCQDISRVGKRKGITGDKSGLWSAFIEVVRELRPRYVLVENTPSLLARGLSRILGDLDESGYDAEWDCLPAAAFGSIHIRDRIFVLAVRTQPIRDPVLYDAMRRRHASSQQTIFAGRRGLELSSQWSREPDVARVDDGVPHGVDRRRVLGNSIVPQIIEFLGRKIMRHAGKCA